MEQKRRSIVKALSWRFLSTFVTGTIVWLLTGEAAFAIKVGLIDALVKLVAYYSHERLWTKITFGIVKPAKPPEYEI